MASTQLDPDLQTVDNVLTRWGRYERRSPQGIHPLEKIRMLHDGVTFSAPAPEPGWVGVVDQKIHSAPAKVRALLVGWYCQNDPVHVKASRLGISRTMIYTHWHGALRFMQAALGEAVHDCA